MTTTNLLPKSTELVDGPKEPANAGSVARPVRHVLSRRKGWRMPENTVKVSRPGRWGNPFVVGKERNGIVTVSKAHACVRYANWLETTIAGLEKQIEIKRKLHGKSLACWCKLDEPCHADVILAVANDSRQGRREGDA